MIPIIGNLPDTRFIDLFAGIGGFRYAMASAGAQCVFSSEWDAAARATYKANHGDEPHGDITKIPAGDIPSHDVLCGGFPCQPFSICGKRLGFADIRGTLFFDIVRIAEHHRPKMLFLENVKNLSTHNNGNTIGVIRDKLQQIGYDTYDKVLCASDYGVPHARQRIFIMGFRKDLGVNDFSFPKPTNAPVKLSDVLLGEEEVEDYVRDVSGMNPVIDTSDVTPELRPIRIGIINSGRQGERIYHPSGHAITLSSAGGGVGAKTGLYYVNERVRKLAPRECARLLGLPDSFIINPTRTNCYRQFGNSVVVDVLQHILNSVIERRII